MTASSSKRARKPANSPLATALLKAATCSPANSRARSTPAILPAALPPHPGPGPARRVANLARDRVAAPAEEDALDQHAPRSHVAEPGQRPRVAAEQLGLAPIGGL